MHLALPALCLLTDPTFPPNRGQDTTLRALRPQLQITPWRPRPRDMDRTPPSPLLLPSHPMDMMLRTRPHPLHKALWPPGR